MSFSMDFMAFFQPPWNLREQQQVSTKPLPYRMLNMDWTYLKTDEHLDFISPIAVCFRKDVLQETHDDFHAGQNPALPYPLVMENMAYHGYGKYNRSENWPLIDR